MTLDHERYLDNYAADSARLALVAARDLAAEVPFCTGWRVVDLLGHAGEVWGHKAYILEERWPAGSEDSPPRGPLPGPDEDPVAWHDGQRDRLLAAFDGLDPAERVWTWAPDDQTVGFWGRRMAQEALVHRIDAEAAAGEGSDADEELVLDGIDELLGAYIGNMIWRTPPGGAGEAVAFEAAGQRWRSIVEADRVACSRDDGPSAAVVRGEPLDLLLWLWGRAGDDVVTIEGDRAVLRTLRDLLRRAGQ